MVWNEIVMKEDALKSDTNAVATQVVRSDNGGKDLLEK